MKVVNCQNANTGVNSVVGVAKTVLPGSVFRVLCLNENVGQVTVTLTVDRLQIAFRVAFRMSVMLLDLKSGKKVAVLC